MDVTTPVKSVSILQILVTVALSGLCVWLARTSFERVDQIFADFADTQGASEPHVELEQVPLWLFRMVLASLAAVALPLHLLTLLAGLRKRVRIPLCLVGSPTAVAGYFALHAGSQSRAVTFLATFVASAVLSFVVIAAIELIYALLALRRPKPRPLGPAIGEQPDPFE